MTKKWGCDKCGMEFDHEFEKDGSRVLWELLYNNWNIPIAEVCDNCRKHLDSVINKFFGKIVVTSENGSLVNKEG